MVLMYAVEHVNSQIPNFDHELGLVLTISKIGIKEMPNTSESANLYRVLAPKKGLF